MITGLSIVLEQNGGKQILRLSGRLDAQTLSSLKEQMDSLFEKMHYRILLDLTEVQTISTEALELLFSESKKFNGTKGGVAFSGISDSVMQMIKNAGFDRALRIYADERDALKAIG